MKLYKRLQKRLAVAATIATVFTAASVPTFAASDYENHWAANAIDEWKNKGIISGYEDGTFKPKQSITRAELATILVKVFGLTDKTGAKTFSDVPANAWFADTVAKVSAAGIMYTEGDSFGPNIPATREEAAYALAKAYKLSGGSDKEFKDNASISSWSQDEIAALVAGGYISGRPDGTFAPKDQLTRADLVAMVDKITGELYNVAGTYSQDVASNVVISTKDVVLKDMTITGNLYIAQGVGDGDVTLENVEVTGEVFVEGGGLNSINLNGKTAIKKLTVNKPDGNVRIAASADAKINQVEAKSGVSLEGTFGEVVATKDVAIKVLGKTVISKITVVKTAEGLKLELSADTVVKAVELEAKADITGKGQVENLKLADDIKKSDLKLEATIKTTTGGEASTSGGGGSTTSSNNNNNNNNSSDRPSPTKSYNISYEKDDTYTIEVAEKAKKGSKVEFTVTAIGNNEVTGVTIEGVEVKVEDAKAGKYSFIMPGKAVEIVVTTKEVLIKAYDKNISVSNWQQDGEENLTEGILKVKDHFVVTYGDTIVTNVQWEVTTSGGTKKLEDITTTGTYSVSATAQAEGTEERKTFEKLVLTITYDDSTKKYSFTLEEETE